MSNRHTGTGRFVSGKSTGVYRGAAKHDPSTEEIKTRLHTAPSRTPVARARRTAVGRYRWRPQAARARLRRRLRPPTPQTNDSNCTTRPAGA